LKQGKHYNRISSCLIDWLDYLKECKQLGMSLTEHRYLYPNNLKVAHEATSKKVKLKRDKQLDTNIKKRYLKLQPFTYKKGGFIVQPVKTIEELFNEGKTLNHCVGTYAEDYANGKTN